MTNALLLIIVIGVVMVALAVDVAAAISAITRGQACRSTGTQPRTGLMQ